ncbi:MAG TPA: hypothetical protein VMW27_15675 [Thermoanaerobaculia bacterium]|nr:hypothetical protein [Thermoanaerobaculia bacterium]
MSDDDRWLRELAQVNREQDAADRGRLDERWDRLSAGQLSPEEEAELRALAESSDEAREAYEAFRPLGPDFQAGVVQAIREQARPAAPAKLLPFSRRRARLAGLGAALAAAAALLVVFARPPVPLPEYQLEVSGSIRTQRGPDETAEVPVFAPGDPFQLVLRPDTAVSPRTGELEAQCFLARGGEMRPLEVWVQLPAGGAARMEGSFPRDLPEGSWTLWAVVGRKGELPGSVNLRSLSPTAPARRRDWVAVPQDVRIQPRGP